MNWTIDRSKSGILMCVNNNIDISNKQEIKNTIQKIQEKYFGVLGNKIENQTEYYVQIVCQYCIIEFYCDAVGAYITIQNEINEKKFEEVAQYLNNN